MNKKALRSRGRAVTDIVPLVVFWILLLKGQALASSWLQAFNQQHIKDSWEFFSTALGLSLLALVWAVYLAVRNIDKLKQAQEALQVSQEKWRSLCENSPDNITEFDLEGKIMATNRVLPGLEGENVVGTSLFDHLPEDQHQLYRDAMEEVQQNEEASDFEVIVDSPGGKTLWSNRVLPVIRLNKIDSFMVIGTNITDRKRAEQTMSQARTLVESQMIENTAILSASNEELKKEVSERQEIENKLKDYALTLKKSHKEVNEFAAILSHDMQEPLRKIITFGNRLQSCLPKLDLREREAVQKMQQSAAQMQNYINALAKFSRISNGADVFEETDLKQVVRDAVKSLEKLVAQTKASVTVAQLPTVKANTPQMRELFQNLIANSIKFHKKEVPPVVKLTSRKTDKGTWEISVEDNGIGFDQKYTERIFKPFERLHGRSAYEGTGMGLAICDKIVTKHHGKIIARSQPEKGATFTVVLPAK